MLRDAAGRAGKREGIPPRLFMRSQNLFGYQRLPPTGAGLYKQPSRHRRPSPKMFRFNRTI